MMRRCFYRQLHRVGLPVPQSNHLESDRLGSPFVYRIDQETGFRNHYPLHAFRFRPDIHDSFYGRRFYRKRHPLYGRDVVSETDKRKRYRKIQAPRTGCHALGRKAGYQQLPIDKRHLYSDINSLDIALDFQQSRRVEKNLKCTLILSDILQSGTLPKSLYKKLRTWCAGRRSTALSVSAAT